MDVFKITFSEEGNEKESYYAGSLSGAEDYADDYTCHGECGKVDKIICMSDMARNMLLCAYHKKFEGLRYPVKEPDAIAGIIDAILKRVCFDALRDHDFRVYYRISDMVERGNKRGYGIVSVKVALNAMGV